MHTTVILGFVLQAIFLSRIRPPFPGLSYVNICQCDTHIDLQQDTVIDCYKINDLKPYNSLYLIIVQ